MRWGTDGLELSRELPAACSAAFGTLPSASASRLQTPSRDSRIHRSIPACAGLRAGEGEWRIARGVLLLGGDGCPRDRALVGGRTLAYAQGGSIVSPGPLSKAHTQLEGMANCQRCHEPGRALASSKCLACHKPVAERSPGRKAFTATSRDCEGCHTEHGGSPGSPPARHQRSTTRRDRITWTATMRPVPRLRTVPQDTLVPQRAHRPAPRATRTRRRARSEPTCSTCHTTATPFVDARKQFDDAKARLGLTGAHRTVDCAKCHVNKVFRGLKSGSCVDCHRSGTGRHLGGTAPRATRTRPGRPESSTTRAPRSR